jgi:hypothetical protein
MLAEGGETLRKISFTTDVHAPFATIWELMLFRIEHPRAQAMKEVRIVERQEGFLVREVRARWLVYVERITIDKGKREIRYTMQDHPLLLGSATMRAVPLSRQSPVSPVRLSMVVDWMPKEEGAERRILDTIPAEIKQEVLTIKEDAEARERDG